MEKRRVQPLSLDLGDNYASYSALLIMILLQGQEEGERRLLGIVQGSLMNIRILSWNVRGINVVEKHSVVKVVIRSQRVDLVCLWETKVRNLGVEASSRIGALWILEVRHGEF